MREFIFLIEYCIKDIISNLRFWTSSRKSFNAQKFARLRTACHILDKGLNAIPFEKGHGESIYKIAKKLNNELKNTYGDDRAFQWTSKIIEEYECTQKETHKKINVVAVEYDDVQRENFFNMIRSRVSCRNFIVRQIEDVVLKEIVEIAVDAPNGCCRQTVRYYLTQNSNKIKQLIPNVAGITCFSSIPCIVFVTSYSLAYSLKDRNLQYVDASLSIENFVLAARAFNVFTTICNFFHAGNNQIKNVKEILNIPKEETIIAVIAMGYSDNVPQKPARMNLDKYLFVR